MTTVSDAHSRWRMRALCCSAVHVEVPVCLPATVLRHPKELPTRLVWLSSWELFARQSGDYRESLLPAAVPKVVVEAGMSVGWTGRPTPVAAIDVLGTSESASWLRNRFGNTSEQVEQVVRTVERARRLGAAPSSRRARRNQEGWSFFQRNSNKTSRRVDFETEAWIIPCDWTYYVKATGGSLALRLWSARPKNRHPAAWATLTVIATLVTVLTPIVTVIPLVTNRKSSIPAIILSIYVCFLVIALLILLIMQEARYRREVPYAHAMVTARKAFTSLAAASWTIIEGDRSEEAFLLHLKESLGFLAEAFMIITGNACRTSIKMTRAEAVGDSHNKDVDVEVVTICRSSSQEVEQPHLERDRIGNNTDFKQIFVEDSEYFYCNDLPAQLKLGYQNSHWDEKTIQSGAFNYRATIVWPIAHSLKSSNQTAERREIIGFLCVDTPATNVFNEVYDVALGAAFAQALHLTLARFRDQRR